MSNQNVMMLVVFPSPFCNLHALDVSFLSPTVVQQYTLSFSLVEVSPYLIFYNFFCTCFSFMTLKRLRTSERVAAANQNAKVVTSDTSVRSGSRDSSKIMKKWWSDQHQVNESILKEKEKAEALLALERLVVKQ